MRLIHYSRAPLTAVYSRPHVDRIAGTYKTPGLWVSVEGEDDWIAWCQSEQWELDGFAHATEVFLAPNANVKHLSSAADIDDFTEQFAVEASPIWIWHRGLDWQAIRSRWQGLIIAPYCWERRLSDHARWYYGWDCASGVLWDATCVKELKADSSSRPLHRSIKKGPDRCVALCSSHQDCRPRRNGLGRSHSALTI